MHRKSEQAKVSRAIKGVDSNKEDFKLVMDVANTETPFLQENNRKIGSNISSLPPEVLSLIFPLAIPPYALLDTTLNAGENSTWNQALRLMKSIVLVCHGWYDAGIIFLYENICIRRGQELESLRQTLTSAAANNLGLLVKSLAIQCYIPENTFDCGADLETVLGCCTSLSTFLFTLPFAFPTQALPIPLPAHITHLRLEGYFRYYDDILPILKRLEETLLSLHIMIRDQFPNSKALQSRPLSLPSLQALSVDSQQDFSVLRDCWSMPSLQRLTVRGDVSFLYGSYPYSVLQSTFVSFLSVHGHQIRQLHIALEGFQFLPVNFKKVLTFCPQLERIIMDPSTFLRQYWTGGNYFTHSRLHCIDLICHLRYNDYYHPSKLCLSKEYLPSLGCVRRFCDLSSRLYKWLDEYTPDPEAEMENFVINVFQHRLDYHGGLYVWIREQDVWEDHVIKGGIYSRRSEEGE